MEPSPPIQASLDADNDIFRRARLRSMKQVAGGLLVLAFAVFCVARSLLDVHPAWGYVAAFAEAAIVEDNKDEELQFLGSSLRSITMYQHGWNTIAKQEGERGNALLKRNPSGNIKEEATVFYMIIAMLKIHEGQLEEAKFYWAGFATQTDIHWPYALTDAAADLRGGQPQRGLRKIKVISQDPAVPPALRTALADRLTVLEAHTGNVDSPLFWPRLISAAVLEELKRTNNEGIGKLVQLLEGVMKKLS